MRRRDFIVLVVGSATMRPLMVHAQHTQKISRIGVLLPGTPESFSLRTKAFLDGLRELGYVEGRTIEIDWKWGQDRVETLSDLAAELVRSNADVIVTGGTFAAQALKAATSTIPIVMAIIGDPVAAGLVGNLARRPEILPASVLSRRNWAESASKCSRRWCLVYPRSQCF